MSELKTNALHLKFAGAMNFVAAGRLQGEERFSFFSTGCCSLKPFPLSAPDELHQRQSVFGAGEGRDEEDAGAMLKRH